MINAAHSDNDIIEPYPSWLVLLHWVTATLVVLAAAAVLSRELVETRELRSALMIVHRGAGLMVLVLTPLRLLISPWKLQRQVSANRALRILAVLTHAALYLVLIANPMLGWALTSAKGQEAYFLGVIGLPPIAPRDRDLADTLQAYHEGVAVALLLIVALHSAAALWHHFVLRDAVLKKMTRLRRRLAEPAQTVHIGS